MVRSHLAFVTAFLFVAGGCASAKKTTPELSKLEGKKIALVEIQGENTPKSIVEVALINQLVKRGTFILISKQDVQAARNDSSIAATDWKGIARKAGAEFALKAKVLKFDADTREGYSKQEVYDSVIEEEQGGDGKVQRLYKEKSLTGHVQVELEFSDLSQDDTRVAIAEEEQVVKAEGKTGGIHLPPKLRFMETITNEAFRKFFEKFS
ncbi:hypothetical protein K2X30_06695 [bacterium]|jgi:hypothetical protein|nr:hypothetical protein [bacterium]